MSTSRSTPAPRPAAATRPKAKAKKRRRARPNPSIAWARRLARYRPRLLEDTLDRLSELYGRQVWQRRLDPTSELVLTILTQSTADVNAEQAFVALRAAYPSGLAPEHHEPGVGWGGDGLPDGPPPDWAAVEAAPVEELMAVIRPAGLHTQKAPRIQATLRKIREERGDHSLEFLGEMAPLAARDWLTSIPGIGKKTASVMLLMCFDLPLVPVDRHIERIAHRVGLVPKKATLDDAHEIFLRLVPPEQSYEAHVNLIRHGRLVCHARNPEHERCPLRDRCRFVDSKAP